MVPQTGQELVKVSMSASAQMLHAVCFRAALVKEQPTQPLEARRMPFLSPVRIVTLVAGLLTEMQTPHGRGDLAAEMAALVPTMLPMEVGVAGASV
jgi:hypothetical protein